VKSRWGVSVFLAVAFGLVSASASAAPADLDRGFGRGGVVQLAGKPTSVGRGMAATSGGRLYVMLDQYPGPLHVIQRILPDGSLDPSFDTDGLVTLDTGGWDAGQGLNATGDGGVIVATTRYLVKLRRDGSVDPSFGKAGFLSLGSDVGTLQFAVTERDRVIVAIGRGRHGAYPYIELSRYLPNGQFDPSFGRGAPVIVDTYDLHTEFALLGGGVAFAESACCYRTPPARLLRRGSDGSPDLGFGRRGRRAISKRGDSVQVVALLAQPEGRMVVATQSTVGRLVPPTLLRRFLPGGGLDHSFGNRGRIVLGHHAASSQIFTDRRGRILIAGRTKAPPTQSGAPVQFLRRLQPNGRVDRSFRGGRAATLFWPARADVSAAVVGDDGRISLFMQQRTCSRSCSPFRSYVARFLGGSSSARCFGRRATIVGTRRHDALRGTSHRDVIAALGGDDTVYGRGGNDLICGGRGEDRLVGGSGRDRVRRR
jgi:uncharacterized delta-60 repeat protein